VRTRPAMHGAEDEAENFGHEDLSSLLFCFFIVIKLDCRVERAALDDVCIPYTRLSVCGVEAYCVVHRCLLAGQSVQYRLTKIYR